MDWHTEPYSLPLKAFEKVISTIKHPISSWAPFTRQIKRKATKTTTMQHIYDDQKKKKKKKNMSYKVNKDEIERKFGHRNHYVSIRNIENVIIYSSNNNKNHNENTKHYFMNLHGMFPEICGLRRVLKPTKANQMPVDERIMRVNSNNKIKKPRKSKTFEKRRLVSNI
eukprot:597717_1